MDFTKIMYISPLYANNVPWSTNFEICNTKYCSVHLTSEYKISFEDLLQFMALTNTNFPNATDITKCISFEPTSKVRFFDKQRLINQKITSLNLAQQNVCMDIHTNQTCTYNYFDYIYNYFILNALNPNQVF